MSVNLQAAEARDLGTLPEGQPGTGQGHRVRQPGREPVPDGLAAAKCAVLALRRRGPASRSAGPPRWPVSSALRVPGGESRRSARRRSRRRPAWPRTRWRRRRRGARARSALTLCLGHEDPEITSARPREPICRSTPNCRWPTQPGGRFGRSARGTGRGRCGREQDL